MDLLGSGSLVHPGLGAGPFTDLGLGLEAIDPHGSHVGHQVPILLNFFFFVRVVTLKFILVKVFSGLYYICFTIVIYNCYDSGQY